MAGASWRCPVRSSHLGGGAHRQGPRSHAERAHAPAVRHPLYLGSVVLGLGFIVAARSAVSGVVVALYLAVTLIASIRTEEAGLERKFGGEYAAYREGRAAPVERPFRLERVWANREHRRGRPVSSWPWGSRSALRGLL